MKKTNGPRGCFFHSNYSFHACSSVFIFENYGGERETEGGRKKEHLNSITSLTMKRIVLARRQFFCRGSNTRDGAFYRKNRFRSLIRGAIGRGQHDGIKRASFPNQPFDVRIRYVRLVVSTNAKGEQKQLKGRKMVIGTKLWISRNNRRVLGK